MIAMLSQCSMLNNARTTNERGEVGAAAAQRKHLHATTPAKFLKKDAQHRVLEDTALQQWKKSVYYQIESHFLIYHTSVATQLE
jgi:hypothetical protein